MLLEPSGVRLHLSEHGRRDPERPSLVWLHHFGGSGRTWEAVTTILQSEFHGLRLDLRGFGDSSPADSYSVSKMADDVLGVVGHLALERFVLIGHSMGGKVAQCAAARQPTGLVGLVLVAASPPTPEPMKDLERQRLLQAHGQRTAALETNQSISRLPIDPRRFETLLEDNLRASAPAWRAWLETGSREDISALMPRITRPALVVAGGADPVLPPEVQRSEVAARLGQADFRIIPGSGHLVPLEAPAPLATLIRGWLLR